MAPSVCDGPLAHPRRGDNLQEAEENVPLGECPPPVFRPGPFFESVLNVKEGS